MDTLMLIRDSSTDNGTPRHLTGNRFDCRTLELPWRDNAPRISCIPPGEYLCKPYTSAKFPDVYEVTGVQGRSAILVHTGNWAGDTKLGYRSDVNGCILVGTSLGVLEGQTAVLSSRRAMDLLRGLMGQKNFTLAIRAVL